jgi:hypothetical protein
MIVNIPLKSSDDAVFLTALNGMLANLVDAHRPSEVYFMRIDRWFDHKWLGYSGRARVAFEGGLWRDTALDAIWREKLTFPPFNPNRVLQQTSYKRIDNTYHPNDDARTIRGPARSHSAKNLQNRVADFTQSGLFVWFSSDTAQLDHASVMSYLVKDGAAVAWFASFLKKEDCWAVHRTKGIDQAAVAAWFPPGNTVRRL